MNAKERILKTLDHEEPDRVPSVEFSIDNLRICKHYNVKYVFQGTGAAIKRLYDSFSGDEEKLSEFIIEQNKRKSFIKRMMKTAVDLNTKIGFDFSIAPLALYPLKYKKDGYIDEYGRVTKFKKNPEDNMDIGYYMGGALNDFEDFEAFPPLDIDNPVRKKLFNAAKELEEKTNGKLYIVPALGGIMEVTWEGFGIESFSRLLAKPKLIKKVFDDRGKFAVELTKRLIEWGETVACLVFDDFGYKKGLFMSPMNYRKYVFPWLERICKTAHKGGIKVILHSCGDIYTIFEDILNAGVDAINPIEPTTANPEYDIFKLNEKYGDKITFIGNVSPQDLADKTPDFIRDYTKKLIKEIGPNGGFILSSGHSINPSVKLENFLAMRETLEKYGKYPIQID